MNIVIPSYVAGPLFLIILFALCFAAAVLIRKAACAVKTKRENSEPPPAEPAPKPKPSRRPARARTIKPRPVKSIEIDPDQVDRIYVRKTG